MTDQTSLAAPFDADLLSRRGLEVLLAEYQLPSTGNSRRDRLENFFRLCQSDGEPWQAQDRAVRVLFRDDLATLERLETLTDASSQVANVVGKPLPDMPIQIVDLKDSIILPDQTVLAGDTYITEHLRHMSGGWLNSGEGYDLRHLRSLNPAERSGILRLPEGVTALSDQSVYFLFHGVIGGASFGHFLHDTMIQLIAFDHLKKTYKDALIPLIVNDLPDPLRYPGMIWLYEGLVGPVGDMVHVHLNAVKVQRGFTTNRLMHVGDGGISFRAVTYLRDRIFDRFKPTENRIRNKYVYISRRDVNNREATNINEVEDLLRDHGFIDLTIQGMPPQDVFDALYDAEVIVGMHGSGLMNYVYARNSALVIELAHEGYLWDSILSFAAACGHRAERVMYEGGAIRIEDLQSLLI